MADDSQNNIQKEFERQISEILKKDYSAYKNFQNMAFYEEFQDLLSKTMITPSIQV